MLDLLIVTGTSRGIGANITAAGSERARILVGIGSSDAVETMSVPNSACVLKRLRLDIGNQNTEEVVAQALQEIGPVRRIGLALCAAQIGDYGGLMKADFRHWAAIYACNVLGNLAVLKACMPQVVAGASLRAVMFAGGGAAYGYPEFSAYALSKVAAVRAVENVGMEFKSMGVDASIIALAPGAVATNMLATVVAHGGSVRTRTNIAEPTRFVFKFLSDEFDSAGLNGRFLHVRDDIGGRDFADVSDSLFKLRRVE